MPIAGLTNVPKAFLKLGQIRKGEKDPKTGAPRDLDYFRVTFHQNEQECAEVFRATYGEQPRAINIRLAFPNVEEVFDANYECYAKGGMIAKASSTQDPVTLQEKIKWIFYRDHETGQVLVRNSFPVGDEGVVFMEKPVDITKPIYSYKNRNGEKVDVFMEPVGRLNVVVPELASIRVGYLEFRPTSPKDIAALSRELAAIDHMARQAGKDITGIPMRLTRREEEISKNINGKLSRGPSWLVHIEVSGEWGGKALEYIERKALPEFIDAEIAEIEPEEWPADIAESEESDPPIPQAQESRAVSRDENNNVRPFSPEALKDWFDKRVEHHLKNKTNVNKNSSQVAAAAMNKIFGNDTDRYVFTGWLVGNASTKKLTGAQVRALLDWMGIESFGDEPLKLAAFEAKTGLEFANALHGQEEMQF